MFAGGFLLSLHPVIQICDHAIRDAVIMNGNPERNAKAAAETDPAVAKMAEPFGLMVLQN